MSTNHPKDPGTNASARESLRALLQDEEKRKRVVSTLAQAVWKEERARLEREKARGMKG